MTHAMPPPFSEHPLPAWRRAVLKVGSSLLAAEGEGLSPRHALNLAQFVSSSIAAGREVVIVSSGAVAAGRGLLHRKPQAGVAMAERQALAALGQAQLIALWQRFFDRPVAQVLLTHDDLRNRRGVRRLIAHASTHVGIEGKKNGAQQNLAFTRRCHLIVFKTEVFRDRRAMRAGSQYPAAIAISLLTHDVLLCFWHESINSSSLRLLFS